MPRVHARKSWCPHLQLHQQVVPGRAAVNAQRVHCLPCVCLDGPQHVAHLERDALEHGTHDVAPVRVL